MQQYPVVPTGNFHAHPQLVVSCDLLNYGSKISYSLSHLFFSFLFSIFHSINVTYAISFVTVLPATMPVTLTLWKNIHIPPFCNFAVFSSTQHYIVTYFFLRCNTTMCDNKFQNSCQGN